jgi:hypothetical protein
VNNQKLFAVLVSGTYVQCCSKVTTTFESHPWMTFEKWCTIRPRYSVHFSILKVVEWMIKKAKKLKGSEKK